MNAKANKAPPRILLVGVPYGLPDADRVDFYTDKHFLDYDIVIMDPQGALQGDGYDYTREIYNDVLGLESNVGFGFHKRYVGVTEKLEDFTEKGGMAIVFLRSMPILNYQVPNTRNEVVHISLDKFLPWEEGVIKTALGSNIEFTTQGPFGQFWEATDELWNYEAVYNDPPDGLRLAHVKGHPNEVVADFTETEDRGFIIMTPVPGIENFLVAGVVKEKKELFIQAVRSLHEALRTEGPAAQLPDWAGGYSLPGEGELKSKISVANRQIDALQKQVGQDAETLDSLCLHKLLATGHDSALEGAVDRVLTDMGLKVEPGPKGRVDRTATYGDRKFAIEVQGVKRGAKEDHVRALIIWVQEVAIQNNNEEPKGLLVVNPYRDRPLAERDENDLWPGETIKICERQNYCAMTGLQLLGLYLDAMADNAIRVSLIDRMFNTKGLFDGYEDWKQFLAPVDTD